MAKRHTPLEFDPSRLRLGNREEVRVGAYARRQIRRRIMIGVFGALLIAGAFAIYNQLRPRGEGNTLEQYPVRVRCTSCGHTATVQVPFGQTFPLKCPACGDTACLELWECRECGAFFIPDQIGVVQRCPACGGERVGTAVTSDAAGIGD